MTPTKREIYENRPEDDSCVIEQAEFQHGNRIAVLQVIKDNKHNRLCAGAKGFENGRLQLNKGYRLGQESRSAALLDIRHFLERSSAEVADENQARLA